MSVVIKYPDMKQPKDKRVYLMTNSRFQSLFQGSQGRNLGHLAISQPRAETE